MNKKYFSLSSVILSFAVLGGCSMVSNEAHFNRGSPESLLDVSSEVVSAPIDSEGAIDDLVDWVEADQPSRAELFCYQEDMFCAAAQEVMDLYGVEYEIIKSEDHVVNLIYERVLARDCENRYIDNSINPYNFNHPTFGCSIASNMVQMVSDKRQFVSPELVGYPDTRRVLGSYSDYLNGEDALTDDADFSASNISLE